MILTKQDNEKVSRNLKALRPSIYDSASKTESPISSSFEVYLILSSDSIKDKILNQLKRSKSELLSGGKKQDKIQLLTLCLSNEEANAKQLSNFYGSKLTEFDALREAIKMGDNTDVTELGTMVDFFQRTLAETLFSRDRFSHLLNYVNYIKAVNKLDVDEKIKEIDSFIKAVTAYKGIV